MSFRSVIFWCHLAAGLVAGLVIAIMSFTGMVLAFEHEIVEWAERDVRRVEAPAAGAARLSIAEMTAKLKERAPEATVASIVVSADPRDAVSFGTGQGGGTYYINPYTGEVRPPTTTKTHDFMHVMVDWHRYLAMSGDNRPMGKAITGACNTAFLVLGLTGLYLWWPRKWMARALKPSLWFVGAKGKARDWNWHNVIGFWSLPVLIVLTASGMVISYRWAGNLVYTLAGETPPAPPTGGGGGGGRGGFAPPQRVAPPAPDARPLSHDGLLASAQKAAPDWETISLRLVAFQRGGRARGAGAAGAASGANAENARPASPGANAISVSVKEKNRWPLFVSASLTLDPYTGGVMKKEGYADYSSGRKARSWMRFLHTGQALGWFGQLIAGIACLGGVVLVYTGFALSYRRFFGRRARVKAAPVESEEAVGVK